MKGRLVGLLLVVVPLCGCASAGEIREREKAENEGYVEYLEDKYGKEFEILENTSGYGEGGRESSATARCVEDGVEFAVGDGGDSYIPMKRADEIRDYMEEQLEDASASFSSVVEYVGLSDDFETRVLWNTCYYGNVDENTPVDKLANKAGDVGLVIVVKPATDNEYEFRNALLAYCEAMPYSVRLTDTDGEVEYRTIYDTTACQIEGEDEWLKKWYR